jgi:UDPglucose 6-dehydrogenase
LEETLENSEFIFICLPTPYKGDKIDLSIMDESLEKITKYTDNTDKINIIKSTVVPGTTQKYSELYPNSNFCFNPEFLTEVNYLEDFVTADRIIIGSDNKEIKKRISDLYKRRFPKIPIYESDSTSAETVKYAANTFLATKVIFANEIFDLCQKLDINYDGVKNMMTADRRIGSSHLDITEDRGFGGKCFPKDLVAFIGIYKDLGIDASLLEKVWEKNLKIRKNRDWEDIPFVKTD